MEPSFNEKIDYESASHSHSDFKDQFEIPLSLSLKNIIGKSVKILTLIERVQLKINAFLFVISDEEIKTTKNIGIGELEVKSAAIFSKKRIQKYQNQVISAMTVTNITFLSPTVTNRSFWPQSDSIIQGEDHCEFECSDGSIRSSWWGLAASDFYRGKVQGIFLFLLSILFAYYYDQ